MPPIGTVEANHGELCAVFDREIDQVQVLVKSAAHNILLRINAIADSIGYRFIANERVPVFWNNLAGDDRGGVRVAILHDLPEVTAFTGFQRSTAEIINDEYLSFCQPLEKPSVSQVRSLS